MASKWLFLICFCTILVTFEIFGVNAATCVKPSNAIPISLAQMNGVWYNQLAADYGGHYFNYACDRVEVFVNADNITGYFVSTVYDKGPKQMIFTLYQVKMISPYQLQSNPLNYPTVTIYMFPLKITSKAMVSSVCFMGNGQLMHKQYFAVQTRSKTASKAYVRSLLKSVGVTPTQEYFMSNYEECYTAKCFSCVTV